MGYYEEWNIKLADDSDQIGRASCWERVYI